MVALLGPRGDHRLQDLLRRFLRTARPARPVVSPRRRVGDPRQPVRAAGGFRAAVAAFRREPRAAPDAARSCPTTGRAASRCWRWCSCSRRFSTTSPPRIIGATVAGTVYRHKLHIGFLAAIVAAVQRRRRGQRGRRHHHHHDVARRRVAARGAARLRGVGRGVLRVRDSGRARPAASIRPSKRIPDPQIHIDWARVIIVVLILVSAIAANIHANSLPPEQAGAFPYIGATVIGVILLVTPWRRPDWKVVPVGRDGQRVPAVAGVVGVDDAGGRTAASRRPRPPSASGSSRPCSTTFR